MKQIVEMSPMNIPGEMFCQRLGSLLPGDDPLKVDKPNLTIYVKNKMGGRSGRSIRHD